MDIQATTFALYAAGAAALATSAVKLKTRLELSKAKHRSLTGHARMSRMLASFVPYYEYDGRPLLPLRRSAGGHRNKARSGLRTPH